MSVTIEGNGLITAGGTSTTQGRVRLAEDTDNGSNYIELTAPASVTSNQIITFPDTTGTVALTSQLVTSGPAFAAYMSANQSVSSSVWTKMAFDTEYFDTDSCYNTSTYRFTPTKAGLYQASVNGSSNSGGGNFFFITIYKNGSRIGGLSGIYISGGYNDDPYQSYSYLFSMNGTTDYLEAYGNTNIAGNTFAGGNDASGFSAVWIRSN